MKGPAHHPEPAFLLDYASGSQPQPVSLAIATHLTLCPDCRREIERLEAMGGAALDMLADAHVAPGALEACLQRLDREPSTAPTPAPADGDQYGLPRPLARALGKAPSELSWRGLGGFALHRMNGRKEPYSVYLIRGTGGTELARHTHGGEEITLVLEGGLTDGDLHLERGDFTLADETMHHSPKADPEGCLLLAVVRGELKFDDRIAGLVGRWFGV